MMNDTFELTQPAVAGRTLADRLPDILRHLVRRMGNRRALRHLLELDDYLLEDMGLSRNWYIAERRRLGIQPGFMDMSGRCLVRSGTRHARGPHDGLW